MAKGLYKIVVNVNCEVFIVHSYTVWHSFWGSYSLSKTFQYCDVDLFVLQLGVALVIKKLEVMKTESGQNISIVLVQLKHVEEKTKLFIYST